MKRILIVLMTILVSFPGFAQTGKVDMFVKEFIPFIEKEYRIRPQKEFRAIAGFSMGGNGALLLSMRHPDLFSSCVAMSAGTFTDEEILADDSNDRYFGNIYGPKTTDAVSEHWKD